MLSRFNIIVAVDEKYGIGKNGGIPWRNKDDLNLFRQITTADGYNAVIVGRKTYESFPTRPLPNRKNIVVSSHPIDGVITSTSLWEALKLAVDSKVVYIIGGQRLYEEAIRKYAYLCDKIIVSHIPGNYDCDTFFPYLEAKQLVGVSEMIPDDCSTHPFTLETIRINIQEGHPEQSYLNLLSNILNTGEMRGDRTGVGTRSLFGQRLEFDLRKGFPLFTTKRTWFKGILAELLFFISGKTDTKLLEAQGVNIWKANTSKEYLAKCGLPWMEGDMGPSYGFQWRHAGSTYEGCDKKYGGFDQLEFLIQGLKHDPFGRRHIISAWDASNIHLMALPPCHCFIQFYVGCEDKVPKYLDACMYQRSADMFLGVPFNVASYALLISIIGQLTGLIPRRFIHDLGDAHIYTNHVDSVREQITRTPYPFPTLKIKRTFAHIDDVHLDDFELVNYVAHAKLTAEMAV